jgi:hypothetical protein
MASRTAILHVEGGQWTLSRAIGEALPQLEAVEREQGIAFGDLVRERRRQRELPLPIAEIVLPFRLGAKGDATTYDTPLDGDAGLSTGTDPLQLRAACAKERVAEAFAALQDAELRGVLRRKRDHLEGAYHAEMRTCRALIAQLSPSTVDAS